MYSKSFNSTFTLALVSFLAMFVSVSYGAPIAIRRSTAIAGRQDTTSSGTTYSGDGTWYETGLGACGITNTDGDPIVAAAWQTFDQYPGATANPNDNPICNKQVTLYYGGKSVTATITDRCAGCEGAADLDMSPSLFDTLVGDPGIGRVSITWHYS
ncbi:RlpA-like double-psi beta-barrel-protein domain-containing protein-containing protein [Lentinula aff. detonsa]|nr:RlpA-like double-psi beta-barrel-protein domain-containing protein-containing protein [Lentinula aff. detonsa]